jgi:Flp pilus assembly protein TadB
MPKIKYDPNIKGSGSALGNALRNNIDTLISSGISIAATKLSANASKGSEQNAIQYEAQKAQTAANQELAAIAQKAAAEAGAGKSSTPTWVLPVGIGVGVLVLGTIVYFVVKK